MLFHPSPEQPTAPNAGILRLEPGAHHPEHYHGFAQVWFILKGEFTIDGRLCPPGTMLYHPDPHFEGAFHTAMQAGVPVVPIVIRNAGELMWRDAQLMHPGTIEVRVLPPVATSEWEPATVAAHAEEVRDMFVHTLANWQEEL